MRASAAAADPLEAAVARVRAGGLVAYPTETVWGLGADACSAAAMDRLRAWKRRGGEQPVAILVADVGALAELGIEAGELALGLARSFWPGPLTLVLPSRRRWAPGVARADGAVGVRCSPHPIAAALARRLRECGAGPLTATSLNRHGKRPARTRDEALRLCAGEGAVRRPSGRGRAAERHRAGQGEGPPDPLAAPLVVAVEGPDAGGGPPSAVVDLAGAKPVALRYGALGPRMLAPWLEGGSPR